MMDETRNAHVVTLLREGCGQQAIEAYQHQAGIDYESARRSVWELADRHGIRLRGRRVFSLALIALAVLLGVLLSH